VPALTPLPRRLVVAITGATGSLFGIRLLQVLKGSDVETHLVLSRWGARTLIHETPFTVEQVRDTYVNTYPELATAAIEGPSPVNGAMEYTFTRAIGAKG